MNRSLAVLLVMCAGLASARAAPNTPWSGQCAASDLPSTVGCQPQAATPLGTNLVLSWQTSQTPKTRALQVQQILSSGLPAAFSTLSASGATSLGSTLSVTGASTFGGLATFSASPTSISSANNVLMTGTGALFFAQGTEAQRPTLPAIGAARYNTQDGTMEFGTSIGWPGMLSATVSSDIIPAKHMSNLIGKTSATVIIIGDSTATGGPLPSNTAGGTVTANGVDPSTMLWAQITDKIRQDNPQITNWTFLNYAIGGSAENGPLLTGTDLGVDQTIYPWFTDLSHTWISYVDAAQPDILLYLFGTNASASGTGISGINASSYFTANMEEIDGWTKVPNVIIITNKTSTPSDTTPGTDDLNSSNHLGQAAFHRLIAQTNAAGYTTFDNVKAKGFGLIDLGRYAAMRLWGYDPASQYLEAAPQYITTGKAIINATTNGVNASTVGYSIRGDYRLTFVLRGQGGATLGGYAGTALRVSASPNFLANYVRLNIDSGGTITPCYIIDGAIFGSPTVCGDATATTISQDVGITVSAAGPHIRVWINGTLALDTVQARFITPTYGGAPINVNFAVAPTGSPTMDITEFYQGVGAPVAVGNNYASGFGTASSGNAAVAGFRGGNNINHSASFSEAYDRQVIQALNFAAPQPGGSDVPGVVKPDGTSIVEASDGTISVINKLDLLQTTDQTVAGRVVFAKSPTGILVNNAAVITGALNVSGVGTFNAGSGTVLVTSGTGSAVIGGNLTVNGTSLLTGSVTAATGLSVTTGGASITGDTVVAGAISASGNFTSTETGWTYNGSGGTALPSTSVSYAFRALAGTNYLGGNYYATSDRRLKSDIKTLTPEDGLRWVSLAKPKTYIKNGAPEAGFIAQDQARAFPQYVGSAPHPGLAETVDPDGFRSKADMELNLSYDNYIAYLTAALQGALDRIEALEARSLPVRHAGMSEWQH